jgi:hypothetical protein
MTQPITILAIIDCFIPESAPIVIETVATMDTEAVGAQLLLEAAIAELFIDPN